MRTLFLLVSMLCVCTVSAGYIELLWDDPVEAPVFSDFESGPSIITENGEVPLTSTSEPVLMTIPSPIIVAPGTSKSCILDSECDNPAGEICNNRVCQKKICNSNSDCAFTSTCQGGYCNTRKGWVDICRECPARKWCCDRYFEGQYGYACFPFEGNQDGRLECQDSCAYSLAGGRCANNMPV